MGTTKTQIFTAEQNELATILKVLANPGPDCHLTAYKQSERLYL